MNSLPFVFNINCFQHSILCAELDNKPLVFVLKMDEAEIVKGDKQERISITIMNHTLKEPTLTNKDP